MAKALDIVSSIRSEDASIHLLFSVCIPVLIITSANTWRLWNEHWEHKAHEPPLEERVEYSYMNIRTKNYPWGDGDKVGSLVYGEWRALC